MLPAQELTPSVACAELHVQHCNDFFSVGNGAWSAISCVKSLKRLAIDDLHCRLDADSLKELATMTQVRQTSCRELMPALAATTPSTVRHAHLLAGDAESIHLSLERNEEREDYTFRH